MRQSHLFTKTRKEAPKDEVSKNAQLLIRAGYIHKEWAGVYALLPLGMRAVEKIKQIVREEMDAIGGQELIMATLQQKDLWEQTGRWDEKIVDAWFKTKMQTGTEIGLAWSHEEPIADMMRNHVASFRDLPVFVYQFQTKLRNELRAKSGIMRGREFVMKDMYSFATGEEQHTKFYNESIDAYMKVYERLGIGDDTFVTYATGGAFTEFSHEFQTITDAGEDTIYINREKNIAINDEVMNDETLKKMDVTRDELEEVVTAEVGNIFNFGTQKCEELGITFKDETGKEIPIWMGSYGIGVTRLLGVLVEKFADEKGIILPENVAPYKVHLVRLGDDTDVVKKADALYQSLTTKGVEVLYDDRDARPGEKFADSDLIGLPTRVIVSKKTIEADAYEVVDRKTGEVEQLTDDALNLKFKIQNSKPQPYNPKLT